MYFTFCVKKIVCHTATLYVDLLLSQVFLVDFLIVCIGRHSGSPNIPEFPANSGLELFKGKILHSIDYSYMDNAAEFVKGKKVTIIGSGKSAFDIAAEVAKVNGASNRINSSLTGNNQSKEHMANTSVQNVGETQPCTMIYRTRHWLVHKSSICGVDLSYFYLNRISQLLVHKPGEGFLYYVLATALSPLVH